MTKDELVARLATNPRRIFNLPEQPDTWIEVDPDAEYTIRAADAHTRCGWTPFEGRRVRGRVERVILRGQVAYEDGKVLAQPGAGRDLRTEAKHSQASLPQHQTNQPTTQRTNQP